MISDCCSQQIFPREIVINQFVYQLISILLDQLSACWQENKRYIFDKHSSNTSRKRAISANFPFFVFRKTLPMWSVCWSVELEIVAVVYLCDFPCGSNTNNTRVSFAFLTIEKKTNTQPLCYRSFTGDRHCQADRHAILLAFFAHL